VRKEEGVRNGEGAGRGEMTWVQALQNNDRINTAGKGGCRDTEDPSKLYMASP
jgi:hypothetical protein